MSIAFSDPLVHTKFIEEYRDFLVENAALQEVVKAVMLNHTIPVPDTTELTGLPEDDPKVIAVEDRYKADLCSFILARTAVDDFYELLTLACNGYGLGALKTLRGMYERVVTSAYVALFPEVSRALVDNTWTHSWKVWRRATAHRPELAEKVDAEKVEALRRRADEAKARHNESFCKSCGQLIQVHAWTKVTLDTMAKKVDDRLEELGVDHSKLSVFYLNCYLEPTAREHATGTSVNDKLDFVGNWLTYKVDSSKERRTAIKNGHVLLLLLLGRQNQHFGFGSKELLTPRLEAFRTIWINEELSPENENAQ